ncbi:unnamed protein product [Prorocentrum cordatum]|uniref:Uncharacterized protein n=1 Tax=Prorocentrum cordatum TaxID=2364126 RepID=A0ABN9RPH2_9DINO|nr:unnamed protein product [Polarella glacialis]
MASFCPRDPPRHPPEPPRLAAAQADACAAGTARASGPPRGEPGQRSSWLEADGTPLLLEDDGDEKSDEESAVLTIAENMSPRCCSEEQVLSAGGDGAVADGIPQPCPTGDSEGVCEPPSRNPKTIGLPRARDAAAERGDQPDALGQLPVRRWASRPARTGHFRLAAPAGRRRGRGPLRVPRRPGRRGRRGHGNGRPAGDAQLCPAGDARGPLRASAGDARERVVAGRGVRKVGLPRLGARRQRQDGWPRWRRRSPRGRRA